MTVSDTDGVRNTVRDVNYIHSPPLKQNRVVPEGIPGKFSFAAWTAPLGTFHGLKWMSEEVYGRLCPVFPKGGTCPY